MIIKSNISELKSYAAKSKATAKPKIDHTIRLYEERNIANFKTALNAVVALAFPITLKNGSGETKAYHTLVAKYEHATPATGTIAR